MRKKSYREERKKLFKTLLKKKVKNVKVKRGWISFKFDGEKIKNKIVFRKHEWYVGSWSRDANEVFIDDDFKGKKDINAVALHESVEKYVTQEYGFPEDAESHKIATKKEREYLKGIGGNWKEHEKKVEKVWVKEGKK